MAGICRGERKPKRKAAAAILPPLKDDPAALLAGEPLRERESQPAALDAAAQRIVRAVKGLEDLLLLAIRNSRAAIEHADVDLAVLHPSHELDVFALVAVLLR